MAQIEPAWTVLVNGQGNVEEEYNVQGMPKFDADWLTFKIRIGDSHHITAAFPTRNVMSCILGTKTE